MFRYGGQKQQETEVFENYDVTTWRKLKKFSIVYVRTSKTSHKCRRKCYFFIVVCERHVEA